MDQHVRPSLDAAQYIKKALVYMYVSDRRQANATPRQSLFGRKETLRMKVGVYHECHVE